MVQGVHNENDLPHGRSSSLSMVATDRASPSQTGGHAVSRVTFGANEFARCGYIPSSGLLLRPCSSENRGEIIHVRRF
jgi:hypothetical protein